MSRPVRLGLLGLGTVGTGLVKILEKNSASIEEKSGVRLEIAKALVKSPNKTRPLDPSQLTFSPDDIFNDDSIDIVVEVIGGIEPAKSYIIRALESGKSVVTANKAVLAAHGAEIFSSASKAGKQLGFEASVCGGIPLIRALSSGMIANEVEELVGILNGTSNYILTRMYKDKMSYEDALAMAQEQGFAESDPTFDVEGIDAAHKLIVLTELTFQRRVSMDDLERQGITHIEPIDIRIADQFGFVIKPIAVANSREGALDLRVHPALVPFEHPLGPVSDEFNAVMVKGSETGEMIFRGKGAGSLPTASAVMSDLIEIARNPTVGVMWNPAASQEAKFSECETRYYLRFPIREGTGLIGKIATVLGEHGISITHASAELSGDRSPNEGQTGNVMIVTQGTTDSCVREALKVISEAGVLAGEPLSLRIID